MKAVKSIFGCVGGSTAATDVPPQDTAGDTSRTAPARRNAPSTHLERLQALTTEVKRAKQKEVGDTLRAQYASAGELLKRARRLSLPLKAGSSEDKTLADIKKDLVSVRVDIADRLQGKPASTHISCNEARNALQDAEQALDRFANG
ncbi:hypothetical protein [Ralstonia solanacearum]|uniref:hypothetical protein n=1 Tax=Ralstonia solanacearum TaxID=305 RepID=UPI0006DD2512|nr:hypothetical protein [Ralstonia solanacearum]